MNLEKNRLARKEWIRSIAHDLNTPISSIRLLAEGLEDGVYQADEYFFSSLKKEIGDLSQKVTTVRYYTSLMDPDFRPDLHAVRLSELIADVVSSYADDTERIRIEIKADAQIETDYALLSRALRNLISNAIRYTTKPGAEVLVAAHRMGGGRVALCVCDAGPGMSREDCRRIFERTP